MTLQQRYNLQIGKHKKFDYLYNDPIDNYILQRIKIQEIIKNKYQQINYNQELEKAVINKVKEVATKELKKAIEKEFKK